MCHMHSELFISPGGYEPLQLGVRERITIMCGSTNCTAETNYEIYAFQHYGENTLPVAVASALATISRSLNFAGSVWETP